MQQKTIMQKYINNLFLKINSPDDFDIESKCYELPDKTILELDKNMRYTPTEIMFKY